MLARPGGRPRPPPRGVSDARPFPALGAAVLPAPRGDVFLPPLRAGLLLAALLALAACDTPAERAETHYQRALALLAEGDEARARLEFRNVFRLDDGHAAARLAFAGLLRDRGETGEALNQLMRLVEQDPKHVAGQRTLAELALEAGDFDTAALAAVEVDALAPADPTVRALKATVDFRKGGEAREASVAMAAAVVVEVPGSVPARMVLVADRLATDAPAEALAQIDEASSTPPATRGCTSPVSPRSTCSATRPAPGPSWRRMATLFPENAAVRAALVQWHLERDDARRRRGGAARGAAGAGRRRAVSMLRRMPGPMLRPIRGRR